MDFSILFNSTILSQTVNSILSEYDKNGDGVYTADEVSVFIKTAKSPLGHISSILYSDRRLIKDTFKLFDYNKDEKITIDEFEKFLKEEYSMDLDTLRNKSAKEVCDLISEENKRIKKEKLKKKN